ncbi:MAG: hypothetical protein LWW81_08260 [Rhodocyclales bacterium]|nr:hypothetical protein [Rhodocyclales bacterium]
MNARDLESALLGRCLVVARDLGAHAQDGREANVFRLAAMLLHPRFPAESQVLMRVSEQYFSEHPDMRLPAEEVIRNGWVVSLPRLRDALNQQLRVH